MSFKISLEKNKNKISLKKEPDITEEKADEFSEEKEYETYDSSESYKKSERKIISKNLKKMARDFFEIEKYEQAYDYYKQALTYRYNDYKAHYFAGLSKAYSEIDYEEPDFSETIKSINISNKILLEKNFPFDKHFDRMVEMLMTTVKFEKKLLDSLIDDEFETDDDYIKLGNIYRQLLAILSEHCSHIVIEDVIEYGDPEILYSYQERITEADSLLGELCKSTYALKSAFFHNVTSETEFPDEIDAALDNAIESEKLLRKLIRYIDSDFEAEESESNYIINRRMHKRFAHKLKAKKDGIISPAEAVKTSIISDKQNFIYKAAIAVIGILLLLFLILEY